MNLRESIEEFRVVMSNQLDLRKEAQNLVRFQETFGENDHVRFPVPNLALSSEHVLVAKFAAERRLF